MSDTLVYPPAEAVELEEGVEGDVGGDPDGEMVTVGIPRWGVDFAPLEWDGGWRPEDSAPNWNDYMSIGEGEEGSFNNIPRYVINQLATPQNLNY